MDPSHFKSWVAELSNLGPGVRIAAVVQLPDGSLRTVGDPTLGLRAFTKGDKIKRKSSKSWLPNSALSPQKCPLLEYFKNSNSVVFEAKFVIRKFLASGQGYGEGECLFWEEKIATPKLKRSDPVLKKKGFKNGLVSLSDIVAWSNLNIPSLGCKPKTDFSVKLS